MIWPGLIWSVYFGLVWADLVLTLWSNPIFSGLYILVWSDSIWSVHYGAVLSYPVWSVYFGLIWPYLVFTPVKSKDCFIMLYVTCDCLRPLEITWDHLKMLDHFSQSLLRCFKHKLHQGMSRQSKLSQVAPSHLGNLLMYILAWSDISCWPIQKYIIIVQNYNSECRTISILQNLHQFNQLLKVDLLWYVIGPWLSSDFVRCAINCLNPGYIDIIQALTCTQRYSCKLPLVPQYWFLWYRVNHSGQCIWC